MGYQIMTGMWACDLQGSSNLDNEEKEEFNKIIKETCEYLIERFEIGILSNQFRGDGLLLVFDPKNMQINLFKFANSFCEKINKGKEEGKIKESFYIRTYMNIGTVQVDENESKVVGKDVDGFCKLVDNKQKDRIQVEEKYSAVLISTDKCYECLEDSDKQKLDKITIGNTVYYVCEYQPKNFVIRLKSTNEAYVQEILDLIKKNFENNSVKMVNIDYKTKTIVVINNIEERSKIYCGLINVLKSVTKKANKDRWKGLSVVLIDLERSSNQVNTDLLWQYFKPDKEDGFSNYLVWSDVSLDEFKEDNKFKSANIELKKYALSEQMRVYFHDFSKKIVKGKNIIYFSQLNEKYIYLHSFDYGGIELIKNIAPYTDLEQYLRQQLEIGLILSDGVIIHSAEVLRSQVVYNILKDYEDLIEDGSIKLLFSSKVNDIKEDFKSYIEEKIREYSISEYGERETASLSDVEKDEERVERTIELLSKCPYMVKRDGDGTSNLEELINNDLDSKAMGVVLNKKEYTSLNLIKYNYSLFQLLNAKYVEKESIFEILPEGIRQSVVEKIEQLVNGVISASIVNSVLEEKIPKNLKEGYKGWYYALIHRTNFLYAKINTGKFLYMEYLPNLWKGSLFDYSKFASTFFNYISVDSHIGSNIICKIRESGNEWEMFKLFYYHAQLLSQFMNLSGFEGSELYDYNIKKAQNQLKLILD